MAPTLNLLHFDRPTDNEIIVREVWGAPSGGGSQMHGAKFSSDGRYAYFYTDAALAQGDINGDTDIYRKDFVTGEIKLITPKAVPGDSDYDIDVSRDGKYLLFSSTASNLVSNDINGEEDVFRIDVETRAITLVSTSNAHLQGNGRSVTGRFSPDGKYVVFASEATNMGHQVDTNPDWADIYIKNLESGGVMLVSTIMSGQQGVSNCWDPKFSADGKYVLFSSGGFNNGSGEAQVLLKDVMPNGVIGTGGDLLRISEDANERKGSNHSQDGQITPDNRYVVFASAAKNLVADTNDSYDIFRKDIQTGAIIRVSTTSNGGEAYGDSRSPQISADGRYVIFTSYAQLAPGDFNGTQDVYWKDIETGQVMRLSETSNHAADAYQYGNYNPQFSPNERYVLFDSFLNYVPEDNNAERDLYSVDLVLKGHTGAVQTKQYIELGFEVGQASSVTIAWGDGSSETFQPTGGAIFVNHAYWTGGVKTAAVTVTEGAQSRTVSYSVDLAAGTIARHEATPDTQIGGGSADVLTGDGFANKIMGGAGNDTLKGMAGNDTLFGGVGKDILTGGTGRDFFVFNTKLNKKTNIDKIPDFNVRDDTIHLAKSVFSKISKKGTLSKSAFWTGHDAKDSNDRIGYDKANGALYYDSDGNGPRAAIQFATLPKKLKGISNKDFYLI